MTEKVIIRQNSRFETEILAVDPEDSGGDRYQAVHAVHELSPYGMLLASLGGCTAIVLHTYAQNHGLALDAVELRLEFRRVFEEDCQNCTEIEQYKDQIEEELVLSGELSEQERSKLFQVAHYCPIHKMLESGMEVESKLVESV